jgi:hypothetical protein
MLAMIRGTTVSAMLALAVTSPLHAQTCNGTPRFGGVDYEYEQRGIGTSQGAGLTLAASHVALNAAYRKSDLGTNLTGQTGETRVSVPIDAGVFLICPGLGLQYDQDVWNATQTETVTARTGTGRAGLSLGVNSLTHGDAQVIPFLGVDYSFAVRVFSLNATGAQNTTTGDTLSHIELNYGIVARFKFVYAGFESRRQGSDRPFVTLWKAGFTIRE